MSFTVSIVTTPNGGLTAHNDIELIKLGLLYADKLSVISPNIYFLVAYIRMATLKGKDRLALFRGILPSLYTASQSEIDKVTELLKLYDKAQNKLSKSYDDIRIIMQVDEFLDKAYNEFSTSAEAVVQDSGIGAIAPMIGNGTIELMDFGGGLQGAAQLLLDGALKHLEDDLTYPIFDNGVTNLISAYIRENDTDLKFGNSKEMVVSKGLFLRLPNVNQLSVDQVTALKGEMEVEWHRYRQLVNEYANDIEGVPFDASVDIKIAKKYEREFKPQLAELQRALNKNSFVRHLYDQLLDNITAYSMLCIGAATVDEVKTAVIGASGVAIGHSFKAFNEKRKQDEKIKENKLFFYHKLSRI